MLRNLILAGAAAMVAISAPAAAQVSLNAGTFGNVTVDTPVPGFPANGAVFTINGGFSSYVQTGLPAVTSDLGNYFFTVSGTATGFDAGTMTSTYSNVVGEIRYINAGAGLNLLIQSFEGASDLTVQLSNDGATGAVFGSLNSTGPVTIPGWPSPGGIVDFSAANGAVFQGTYTRTDALTLAGTYSGTLSFQEAAVPEPATWAMMIGGFGMVGGALRLRRRERAIAIA